MFSPLIVSSHPLLRTQIHVPRHAIGQMAIPIGIGKRGHIVAHDVSWAAQTGKHLLRTQNVSEQNQEHFCVPDTKQMLRARVNGETFVSGNNVSATMCPRLPVPYSFDWI